MYRSEMSRRDVDDEVRRKLEDEDEDEYEVQDMRERIKSSRGSRFDLIANELGLAAGSSGASSTRRRMRYYLSRESVINGVKGLSKGIGVIHPDNRSYYYSTSFFIIFYN